MQGHHYFESKLLKKYDQIFNLIYSIEKKNPFNGNYNFPATELLWDSIVSKEGPLVINNIDNMHDIQHIKASLLIENIEYAFKVFKLPWARYISFEDFCEYILPYRFYDEDLKSWRPEYYSRFSWVVDSVGIKNNSVEACRILNSDLKKWFRFNVLFEKYPHAINAGYLLKTRMGKCLDQAGIATFAMRSIGIPVAHEVGPQWGNRSMGHDFSSVLGKDGKFIDFQGAENPPAGTIIKSTLEDRDKPPKIFRQTFSIQLDQQNFIDENVGDVPMILNNCFWKDVTKEFVPVTNIKIRVKNNSSTNIKYAYLAVFNNREWIPIYMGKIKGDSVTFESMGREIVYLPVFYRSGILMAAANPVELNREGKVTSITPNLQKIHKVVLTRKYPLTNLKKWWMTLMGGGRFQGSNKADFSDVVDLFCIPDMIDLIMHKKNIKCAGEFVYIRYLFPKNGFGSLGEVGFYSKRNNKYILLTGEKLKSNKVSQSDLDIAFDCKLNKFVHTERIDDYNGEWIGLKLSQPTKIDMVGFSPRNDTNNIFPTMKYELFYWNDKWISLGVKVADSNELVYDNVPSNALLLLKNRSQGTEERIFTYQNAKQVWW